MRLESARPWWRARGRWERFTIIAWVLLLTVVGIRAFFSPRAHSVYPIFADAGRRWCAGEDLYRECASAGKLDVYRYSPLVAALLAPLSAIADSFGGALWRWLNAGVLLGGLCWWCRAVLPAHVTRDQNAILFLIVLSLSIGNFNNAQSNPLVLGLVLAGVAGAADRRWNLAAGCIALACLFKVYPIAVGLLLVAVYPRQLAGRIAGALAIGLALPFLFQRPEYVFSQYSSWLESMCGDDRSSLSLERCYRDLALLARLLHHPVSSAVYRLLQVAAGAFMAWLCLARQRAGGMRGPNLVLLTGLGCCWMTILGPATESCTYLLLAPPLGWALIEAWTGVRPTRNWIWLAASYGLLLLTYTSCWLPSRYHLQPIGLQPFAGLLFLAYLAARALDRENDPVAEICLAPGVYSGR